MNLPEKDLLKNWITVAQNIWRLYQSAYHNGWNAKMLEYLKLALDYENTLIHQIPKKESDFEHLLQELEKNYPPSDEMICDYVTKPIENQNPEIIRITHTLTNELWKLKDDESKSQMELNDFFLLGYAYFLDKNTNPHADFKKQYFRLLYFAREIESFLIGNDLRPIPFNHIHLNLYIKFHHDYSVLAYENYQRELYQFAWEMLGDLYNVMEENPTLTYQNPELLTDFCYLKNIIFCMSEVERLTFIMSLKAICEEDKEKKERIRQYEAIKAFLDEIARDGTQMVLEVTRKRQ